jgi:hypothetical protein
MQVAIDTAITYRILRLLVTPWKKQKAYAYGIIDEHGNPLRKYSQLTQEEKNCYTILVRLVFRLKRIIEKVPVGNKQFLSYAAALALLKESAELEHEPIDFELMFFEVREMEGLDVTLVEAFINDELPMKTFMQFCEDGDGGGVSGSGPSPAGAGPLATNTTGPAVPGTGDDSSTVVVKKKPKIAKRKMP